MPYDHEKREALRIYDAVERLIPIAEALNVLIDAAEELPTLRAQLREERAQHHEFVTQSIKSGEESIGAWLTALVGGDLQYTPKEK